MKVLQQALCRRIGYVFKNEALLTLALTHRSVSGSMNNERLEFLGDSILNFIIAEALFQKFERAKEGKLSRLRAKLVKEETLADLARQFDLGDCLILGSGELKSGGYRRDSILSDALEAIIGAMYLDEGMDGCKRVVLIWFAPLLDTISLDDHQKDPKTRLQELLQSRKEALPVYQVDSIEGEAHHQLFVVSCRVDALNLVAVGQGGSRRQAEQLAAEKILAEIKL